MSTNELRQRAIASLKALCDALETERKNEGRQKQSTEHNYVLTTMQVVEEVLTHRLGLAKRPLSPLLQDDEEPT